jgi:hypothetical protein
VTQEHSASQRVEAFQRRRRQEEETWNQQRPFDDQQILTFKEWCALNRFSPRNGRRILAGEFGPPPAVVRLSPRRIGISRAANRAWQQSRVRPDG